MSSPKMTGPPALQTYQQRYNAIVAAIHESNRRRELLLSTQPYTDLRTATSDPDSELGALECGQLTELEKFDLSSPKVDLGWGQRNADRVGLLRQYINLYAEAGATIVRLVGLTAPDEEYKAEVVGNNERVGQLLDILSDVQKDFPSVKIRSTQYQSGSCKANESKPGHELFEADCKCTLGFVMVVE